VKGQVRKKYLYYRRQSTCGDWKLGLIMLLPQRHDVGIIEDKLLSEIK